MTSTSAAPAGGPDRQVIVVNLGNALRIQALVTPSPPVREEAITLLRAVLDADGPTGAMRASAAYNLATSLLTDAGVAPARVEIDDAIDLLHEAVGLVGEVGRRGRPSVRARGGLCRAPSAATAPRATTYPGPTAQRR